jgi:cytochrome c553
LKRILIVCVLSLVLVMAMASVAFASFGPHGSYTTDTDSCAACHRAHTAFSSVARINFATGDAAGAGSALLVSSATNMDDFCYACHGAGGPGASTDVELGKFDAGPSGAKGVVQNIGAGVLYTTNSSFDATLNGGGFAQVNNGSMTSNHTLDAPGVIWGYGQSASDSNALLSNFNCTSCHDPHGSSNYRLLNDKLMGKNVVGGYVSDTQPTPFVISAEQGYPAGGFSKHTDAMAAGYTPNYTTPEYRFDGDAQKSISGWCSGCHEQYINNSSTYSYGTSETALSGGTLGSVTRHRHPVNMNLETGRTESGQMTLATDVTTSSVLPLEMAYSKDPDTYRGKGSDYSDVVGCLTCHVAHGTSVTMTGWAESSLDTTHTPVRPSTTATWFPVLTPGSKGVNPNFSSSLLRAPNRGVCERCHNK